MKSQRQTNSRGKKGIKVTYISSPMKVKTSASNFRALVQELTGQYSHVAEASYNSISMEEAHQNVDDELIKASSEVHESQEAAWLKHESISLLEPNINEQLLLDLFSFDFDMI